MFQSSVRINVGPNFDYYFTYFHFAQFQSSVRINVGPNSLPVSCVEKQTEGFNPP